MNNPYEKTQRLLPHWSSINASGAMDEQEQLQEGEMNATLAWQQHARTSVKHKKTGRDILAEAQIWGAIIGLGGGLAVAVLGSLLTISKWITADAGAKHWLATMGTVLLCLTIPLIVFGACCLDWQEKDKTTSSAQVKDDDDEL